MPNTAEHTVISGPIPLLSSDSLFNKPNHCANYSTELRSTNFWKNECKWRGRRHTVFHI